MGNNEKEYISLKEAAKISGYSPDYIGHLIRTGKIPGRMVYTGISWQTTKEAILAYKNRQQKKRKLTFKEKVSESFSSLKGRLIFEFKLLKLFFNQFKIALLVILFFLLTIFAVFSWFFSLEKKEEIKVLPPKVEEPLRF